MLDSHVQPSAAPSSSPARESTTTTVGAVRAERAHISSARLLAGARELVIEHAGQEYHLRLTRNDKLILTK
jgi:hemin uptake protein HemP